MTYKELYESAINKLKKGEITLGEFKKMIEPLNAEVGGDTDTISRQAAIEACGGYLVPANIIKQLPPTQPERIKAKWLPIGMADAVGGESTMWGDEIAYHACDNCWQQALEKDGEEVLSDFCPHCGADMRGEQE